MGFGGGGGVGEGSLDIEEETEEVGRHSLCGILGYQKVGYLTGQLGMGVHPAPDCVTVQESYIELQSSRLNVHLFSYPVREVRASK